MMQAKIALFIVMVIKKMKKSNLLKMPAMKRTVMICTGQKAKILMRIKRVKRKNNQRPKLKTLKKRLILTIQIVELFCYKKLLSQNMIELFKFVRCKEKSKCNGSISAQEYTFD